QRGATVRERGPDKRAVLETGSTSFILIVLMVPVFFGMMGFAFDLGRLYLIRGELSQAANSMALAAASQLLGTSASADNMLKVLPPNGPVYNYNFGAIQVGMGAGNLTSTVGTPNCFDTAANATSPSGSAGDCTTATAVQLTVTADAPLLFWSLLPGGTSRKTSIGVSAVAGISAPLCTICNTVPIAVPAIDATDTLNFGYDASFSTLYTLSYQCTGTPAPINYPFTSSAGINGGTTIPYEIVNHYDANNALMPDEFDQLYVSGAQGMISSTNPTPNTLTANTNTPLACMNVGDFEQLLAEAVPPACARGTNQYIQAFTCGIYARLDNANTPAACTTAVTDFGALSVNYQPDTDVTPGETPPYSAYTGNGRAIITVAVVGALAGSTADPMQVLGFRQFLVVPNPDGTFFDPSDPNGRIPVLYIGNPAPVQNGWFDTRYAGGSCPVGGFSGPGKVVLHR
ncbi:MAG TPA: pilus assembly protein TadG-related protein, partial [Candidatus Solibacter sp.]|nr:pilus assembly protein TadG-related protein [Candidatus Solibacter sp.]